MSEVISLPYEKPELLSDMHILSLEEQRYIFLYHK